MMKLGCGSCSDKLAAQLLLSSVSYSRLCLFADTKPFIVSNPLIIAVRMPSCNQ